MGRLADKTRVLVTNQLQYVSHADYIYYMEDGRITESGPYNKLMEQGGAFASLLKQAEVTFSSPSFLSVYADGGLACVILSVHACAFQAGNPHLSESRLVIFACLPQPELFM